MPGDYYSKLFSSLDVYKAATCACCKKWADLAQQLGFTVRLHDVVDLAAIKNNTEFHPTFAHATPPLVARICSRVTCRSI